MTNLPFNLPHVSDNVKENLQQVLSSCKLSGDGEFTKKCNQWFSDNYLRKTLITHSGTAALEMMAILLNLEPGDEVIMPSYTFVSTANAVVLRGAVPVFVDIEESSLNIDPDKIEEAITSKTKAIMVVHYAGISCDMERVLEIAEANNLVVIEDAAQAFYSTYKGQLLGTIGALGALSFHETKNIISGEGGALIINNEKLLERAEIIREKGTDRSRFFRGQVDKYTWVDIGSSYLPSELIAAYLYTELNQAENIINHRVELWNSYHDEFDELEKVGKLRRPVVPSYTMHNGHMYYLLLQNEDVRAQFIQYMKGYGISTVFHYIPLHTAPAGLRYGRYSGELGQTDNLSARLVRMPLYYGLKREDINRIVNVVFDFFNSRNN